MDIQTKSKKIALFFSTENEIMDLQREYYKISKQLSKGRRGALWSQIQKKFN